MPHTSKYSSFVDVNRIYTIRGLCTALGVEERTIIKARRQGLKVKLFGERRIVIRGADVDEFLRDHAEEAPLPKGPGDTSENDE